MPSYEFECQECAKEFTLILSVHEYEGDAFECPHCHSRGVERLITSAQVVTSRKS